MSVIAHHLVWTAYGNWLPNDPRGSGSKHVMKTELQGLGPVHFGRKRHQPASNVIRSFYQKADPQLNHDRLAFKIEDLTALGSCFSQAISQFAYTCYAAALMPDHVHLVIRRHRDRAEQMIESLQKQTAAAIVAERLRPATHPVWTRNGWKTFLRSPDEVRRTIGYVERNPLEIGWKKQDYKWVTPYDGWPFHKKR
jgi:REP element-mobilizing transposase RayT